MTTATHEYPDTWVTVPDPEVADEAIGITVTHDGHTLAVALNEEGRPHFTVIIDFGLVVYPDGDYVIEGTALHTFPTREEAIGYATDLATL